MCGVGFAAVILLPHVILSRPTFFRTQLRPLVFWFAYPFSMLASIM
jgi:hypothetical protein